MELIKKNIKNVSNLHYKPVDANQWHGTEWELNVKCIFSAEGTHVKGPQVYLYLDIQGL